MILPTVLPIGGGGGGGREQVEIKRKGQIRTKAFDSPLRPVDNMGPGRYETEDMANTTRKGRLGEAFVPSFAAGLPREEAVGPRGERPAAAVDFERQDEAGVRRGSENNIGLG